MPDTQLDHVTIEGVPSPSGFGLSINPWIIIVVALAVIVIWYLFGSKLRFWNKSPLPEPPTQSIDPLQLQMLQMQAMMQLDEQQHHRQPKNTRPVPRHVRIVEPDDDESDQDMELETTRSAGFPVELGGLVELIAINSERSERPGKANVEELESDDDEPHITDTKEELDEERPPKVKLNKPRKRKAEPKNKNQEDDLS
jgi:hypothetical protein